MHIWRHIFLLWNSCQLNYTRNDMRTIWRLYERWCICYASFGMHVYTLIRTIVILNILYLNNIPAFIHVYAHCYYGILKYKVDVYEASKLGQRSGSLRLSIYFCSEYTYNLYFKDIALILCLTYREITLINGR
jgi:hypothetical protein